MYMTLYRRNQCFFSETFYNVKYRWREGGRESQNWGKHKTKNADFNDFSCSYKSLVTAEPGILLTELWELIYI